MRRHPLSESSYRFRSALIERLDRFTPPERFWYIGADVVVMCCPVCGGGLAVRFAGFAARAALDCLVHGCSEPEIRHALGLGPARVACALELAEDSRDLAARAIERAGRLARGSRLEVAA